MQGLQYAGFPLTNPNTKSNKYRNVLNYECQYLCKITEGCSYYNYKSATKECFLKYGMGNIKYTDGKGQQFNNGFKFGHKNSINVTENVACHWVSTSCNATCGFRNKFIITPPTGKQRCSEDLEPCGLGLCGCKPNWSEWSSCDCHLSRKTRTLTYTSTRPGESCQSRREEHANCDDGDCPAPVPIDCNWSEWSACSATCAGTGVRTQSPRVQSDPLECPEDKTEPCESNVPCPVNCEQVWSDWSNCDCSKGKKKRTRHCPEEENETKKCKCQTEAGSAGAVGAVVVVVMLIIILVAGGGGGGYFFYKKRTKRNVIRLGSDHQVLVKDDMLKDKLNELTEDPGVLFREFQQLETEVRKSVPHTAIKAVVNKPHNRYGDIGE